MKWWRVYMQIDASQAWLFVSYCRAKNAINAIALTAKRHKHLTNTQAMRAKEMKE